MEHLKIAEIILRNQEDFFIGIPENPFMVIHNEGGNFIIDVLSSLGALLEIR